MTIGSGQPRHFGFLSNSEHADHAESWEEEELGEEADYERSEVAGGQGVGKKEDQQKLKPQPRFTVDDIRTAPMDYRFPTTNQAKHCHTRYNEFHKCIAEKGDDASECKKYARHYRSLCPGEWVDKWNEQRQNGTFAGRY